MSNSSGSDVGEVDPQDGAAAAPGAEQSSQESSPPVTKKLKFEVKGQDQDPAAQAQDQDQPPPALDREANLNMDLDLLDESWMDEDSDVELEIPEHDLPPWTFPGSAQREENYQFKVLSRQQVMEVMETSVEEVNRTLQLPGGIVRALLAHFQWDQDKLLEAYFGEDGAPEKLFEDAKIPNPSAVTSPPAPLSPGPEGTVLCPICYTAKNPEMMFGMTECGHQFCRECWSDYLSTKIMAEGIGETIPCAAHKCPYPVSDKTVLGLLKDQKVKEKYAQLSTNSFVQNNKLIRWCPTVDCPSAIQVSQVEWRSVACSCGSTFCFNCGQSWHDPVTCHLLKLWIRKVEKDSETANWMAANTKECPKCKTSIEKNGGCNHMTCKKCSFHFCWVCLGPWDQHGNSWYNCNRYDEADSKAARDAQEHARSQLSRFLFFCNRYRNHMQSLRFENKLYESTEAKMLEMQQHNMSWIDVQYLKQAVDILCQCRQTLMYTYVFAFYLTKTNESAIFQDNQRDLESATEVLSEYLERDINSENLSFIKQKVQDKSRYCEVRRKVLVDHVHDGYEKGIWTYNTEETSIV